ncbi:MAG TPA: histidinol-phosphatase HisJ family protein [Solirubrobacteraceae bacterium]|nr:histidinol-phosphatase HisJ family protein [Solirubrobacteraceae bacterium]
MLTDYHLHLRPDDAAATASEYFTAANVATYREAAQEAGIEELGVSEHIHRFEQSLDIWDHPFWRESAVDDIDDYCAFVREQTDLRLGIEMDFVPGREDRTQNIIERGDFDYVIGSVHFLGDLAVDWERFDIWDRARNAEEVWRRYFETLAEAARSGLFDILAHPDLVKMWGAARPVPDGDPRRYYEPALEAIAESGVAIEVSTAGLRKPVGEIYPARAFLEEALEAGSVVALSSDAHVPAQIGFGYEQALALLREVGVDELAVFERRTRRMEPIG